MNQRVYASVKTPSFCGRQRCVETCLVHAVHCCAHARLAEPSRLMFFHGYRVGRGGRIMLDRAHSSWNKQLSEIDLHPEFNHLPHEENLQELLQGDIA